jgi:hypothetical protein
MVAIAGTVDRPESLPTPSSTPGRWYDQSGAAPRKDQSKDQVSKRLEKSWIVLDSRENPEGDRCVDLFVRPDSTYGFEEFRRDPEDVGAWTPVHYFSGLSYASKDEALDAARRLVPWLQP